MSPLSDDELDQCDSHSNSGERCTGPSEHEGRHTWDVLSEEQIERAFGEARDDNAESLSLEGAAGESRPMGGPESGPLGDDHVGRGGVADELEEAADMGSADGLGADPKPLLDITRQELGAALAASRVMLEHAPGDGEYPEPPLRSFVQKVEAHLG
jgi:hypothetical protein